MLEPSDTALCSRDAHYTVIVQSKGVISQTSLCKLKCPSAAPDELDLMLRTLGSSGTGVSLHGQAINDGSAHLKTSRLAALESQASTLATASTIEISTHHLMISCAKTQGLFQGGVANRGNVSCFAGPDRGAGTGCRK